MGGTGGGAVIDIDPSTTRRILIRANNWIGDVVMIAPAVRAIRERYAGARLAIVAKDWVLETLAGNPFYDELIEYDPEGRHAGFAGRMRVARAIRRGGSVDLAVLFQKAFDAAVIALLAGARARVGYATDARGALLTHALPPPPSTMHHAEAFLGLARALGCRVDDARPFFHVGDEARGRARALVATPGLSGSGPLVALHVGASKPPRAWHAERFGDLARRLRRRLDARLVILVGPGEEALLGEVTQGLARGSFLACGTTESLRHSAAVIEQCALFVGNDSGPMHIAAALGVATLGIFGPGLPRNTAPIGRAVAIVSRDYPCAPCRQAFFTECPPAPSGKPFCLEEISVDEVERAALALLASPRAEPGCRSRPPAPGDPLRP
jgi:lipopolysaccharide heptosyltransferase II